jgi:hypothetical protein
VYGGWIRMFVEKGASFKVNVTVKFGGNARNEATPPPIITIKSVGYWYG